MTSNEFPRPISFDAIQAGDAVRSTYAREDYTLTRVGIAGRKERWGWATTKDSFGVDRVLGDEDCTWELLDRPVKRGPQYSAVAGDRFVDPSGAICVRTDQPAEFRPLPQFLIVSGPRRGYMVDSSSKVDALVPYQPPAVAAELERLRDSVIEHASDCGRPNCAFAGCLAVRALRDHQAKS